MKAVYRLTQCSKKEKVGMKAWNLFRLSRCQFPVPEGFCLSTKAHRAFLQANNIEREIRRVIQDPSRMDANKVYSHITGLIQRGEFPDSIQKEFQQYQQRFFNGKGTHLAVRSSALVEDSDTASFAGQFETVLNVRNSTEDLLQAVKQCWASLWKPHITKSKLDSGELLMGVIVQRMIASEYAGVVFTQNPITRQANEIVIEVVSGLANSLVSGAATPSRLILAKDSFAVLKSKNLDGFDLQMLIELAKYATQIEERFRAPQDIEWAFDGENLFFLQTRPITTLQKSLREKVICWTDTNVGEVIPDIITPLTWSIAGPMTNGAYQYFLQQTGVRSYLEEDLFEVIEGKVYFNETSFAETLERFHAPKHLANLRVQSNQFWKNGIAILRYLLQMGLSACSTGRLVLNLPAQVKAVLTTYPKRLVRFADDASMLPDQILIQSDSLLGLNRACMNLHITVTILGEIFYKALGKCLRKWLPDSQSVTRDELLLGTGETESAKIGIGLQKIAMKIASDERISTIFTTYTPEQIEVELEKLPPNHFAVQLINQFFEEYGYGSLHEFELLFPRWHEDPSYIYHSLQRYLLNVKSLHPEAQASQALKKREEAIQHTFHCLSWIQRRLVNFVLEQTIRYCTFRESLKQLFLKGHWKLKKLLNQLAGYWIDMNLIKSKSDIFFLSYQEIKGVVNGELRKEQIRAIISTKQEARQRYLKVEHPARISQIGKRFDWQSTTQQVHSKRTLHGIGCSAGQVVGRARVILKPEESDEVGKGDILIARATNPGWTPLLALAGGIVTEVGGALSHGAIISREYGIPYVANARHATSIIRTGNRIKVDGVKGIVEILE